MFAMERLHHGFLFDPEDSAIRHSRCRAHANRLARKRAFAEKVSLLNMPIVASFPALDTTVSRTLAFLDIEHRISSVPLVKIACLLGTLELCTLADCR